MPKVEKVKVEDISQNDIIIALMGPTGSGKSTFIECATKQKGATVGHELQSYTAKIRAVRVTHPKTQGSVVFIDTPGFDDTYKSDTEILQMIADWLEKTYKNMIRITGIIYLHRISDNRMSGSPYKNLRMFAKLCGDEATRHVVLVTTMWSSKIEELGSQRQKQLVDRYWKPMLEHGSKVDRFDGTFDDAWRIVDQLGDQVSDPLLLQEELVDLGKRLSETEAGIALYNTLQKSLAEQKELIRKLQEEAEKKNDPQLARELQKEHDRIQETLRITFDQIQQMKIPLMRRIRLWFILKSTRSRAFNI